MRKILLGLLIPFVGLGAVLAQVAPEKITVPENYQSHFIRYSTVDREGNAPKVRFLYVNPEALNEAKAGEPAPFGTTLVMEDRKIKLDVDGEPVRDSKGRFIPTDEIIGIIIQQKEEGWGEGHPADIRNGNWEYAIFTPDHTPRTGVNYNGCLSCHNRVAPQDFNFSFASFLERIKGGDN